jgi:hypothetical protein
MYLLSVFVRVVRGCFKFEKVEEKGKKKKNRGVTRSLSQSRRDWLVEFSKQICS